MDPSIDDERVGELFMREEPVAADVAIVFSCESAEVSERRVRHAANLFHAGFFPILLLSGGGSPCQKSGESQHMEFVARAQGVPEEALLFERESSTTAENAVCSRDVLEKEGLLDSIETILLISSEWHMRRVFLRSRKTFPPSIRLVCCPPPDGVTRDNWRQTESGRRMVLRELALYETFRDAGLYG